MSQVIMDSSPQPAPPVRRSLKRSASTASLPTPPHSVDKVKRLAQGLRRTSSQHGSEDEDTEDEQEAAFAATLGLRLGQGMGSATSTGLGGQDASNPFWLPGASGVSGLNARIEETHLSEKEGCASMPATQVGAAPMSPPRSRRQVRPVTPTNAKSDLPVRDSPNNPFLAAPGALPKAKMNPTPPQEVTEKPTLTYVFRGIKTQFANPLYKMTPSRRELGKLPMEHPDFSPDPVIAPRVLFAQSRRPASIPGSEDEEEEEEAEEIKPKRLFGSPTGSDRTMSSTSTDAGRPLLGRTASDVHRMIHGPKRGTDAG